MTSGASDFEAAVALQTFMVEIATGSSYKIGGYERLRKAVIELESCKGLVPDFVRANRTADQFWSFIKQERKSYESRRRLIYSAFQPLLDKLEGLGAHAGHVALPDVLHSVDTAGIAAAWSKAIDRRTTDPEGAITSARALLETVCKHILDDKGITYGSGEDLPKLYNLTCQQLNLAPNQHSEDVFKRILGGCTTVAEGLGALRNRLGDAHGQGRRPVKPAPRHAGLAVNLAGSMATFLVETWKRG